MSTPALYRLARPFVRFALAFYFREIEVAGERYIPPKGPVIFAANHPRSIVDALVLGLAAGRPLHFLGHSGLFSNKLKSLFLENAGVIPVYRRSGDGNMQGKNKEMFAACAVALENGAAIGIFPEGTSHMEKRVRRIKTGAARIALETEDRHNFSLGVLVTPVGLDFESLGRLRSRVLVSFGEPIDVREYEDLYRSDPYEAVNAFTEDLTTRMRSRVMNLDREELAQIVEDLEKTYREDLSRKKGFGLSRFSRFRKKRILSQEIAKAVNYFYDTDPDAVWHVAGLLRQYRKRLKLSHLSDRHLGRDLKIGWKRRATGVAIFGALGMIPALLGTISNALPYKLTGWAAKRRSPDATQYHQFQLVFGVIFYLLYYVPLLYVFYRIIGGGATAGVTAALLVTGFFARWYAGRMTRGWDALRYAIVSARKGYYVQELKMKRATIVRALDELFDRYVAEGMLGSYSQSSGSKEEPS